MKVAYPNQPKIIPKIGDIVAYRSWSPHVIVALEPDETAVTPRLRITEKEWYIKSPDEAIKHASWLPVSLISFISRPVVKKSLTPPA